MPILKELETGWDLAVDCSKVLVRHPVLFIPLFITWLIVASLTIYINYYYEFPESFWKSLGILFLQIQLVTLSLSFSCLVMLEFVEQIELGQRPSLFKASIHALFFNLWKAIPLTILWAIIWIFLLILKAIFSSRKDDDTEQDGVRGREISAKNIGETLSGRSDTDFSLFSFGISVAISLVRIFFFFCLPSIAWEGNGPIRSIQKARKIVWKHPTLFISGYSLIQLAGFFMLLVLGPIFFAEKLGHEIPDFVWVGVTIYSGIVWTITTYMEQMTMGLLYLWYLKWERKGARGKFTSVRKPCLLDEIPEFASAAKKS